MNNNLNIDVVRTYIFDNISNNNYQKSIEELLKLIENDNKLVIEFALHCAKDLDKYYDVTKYPEVYKIRQRCLELIGDWLLGKPVKIEELNAAARTAYAVADAAYAAADAAYAAAAAANAAYAAAAAADAAARTAYAAADAAANAVSAAANAAAYAAAKAAYAAAKAAYATYYAAGYAANAAAYAAKAKELHLYLCELIIKKYKLANIESFRLLYN